jgi:FdhD protein
VARELPLTIFLNERKLTTIACSPSDLGHLAVGFLLSKGLLKDRRSIELITVDIPKSTVWIKAEEAKPSPVKKVTSGIEISVAEITALLDEFGRRSELFQATGGVHSAALCDRESMLVFAEDISRHNAIDKVFGRCFMEGMDTAGQLLITSGRVSSEIVEKVARREVLWLVSGAAPTDLGVKLAKKLGLTLIGFAREGRMNVYSHEERLKDG